MTVPSKSRRPSHKKDVTYYDTDATIAATLLATSYGDLNSAVANFESAYGFEIVFDGRNVAGETSEGRVTYVAPSAAQLDYVKQAVKQIVEEFSRYPPAFVRGTGFSAFYLVGSFTGTYAGYLAFTFGVYKSIWCQLYTSLPYTGYGEGPDKYRNLVNHEFMHMIDGAYSTDYNNQKTSWEAINPTGFTYGNNAVSPGFITGYSNSSYIEDRAEIHTWWMSPHHYWEAQGKAIADPRLAQKAAILSAEIQSKSAAWLGDPYKTANGDTKKSTTTTPSTGTGTTPTTSYTFVGPRSRLPWYSGAYLSDTGTRTAYESGRGRPLDAQALYVARDSATSMVDSWWINLAKPVTDGGGLMVLGVPLWAQNQSISTDTTSQITTIGQKINAAGISAKTNIRLSWEMNLPGSYHCVTTSNYAQWVAKFKQTVTILRQQCPGITVSFNPNEGADQTNVNMETLATDLLGYYEFVGPDYYNWYPSANTDAQWTARYTGYHGIKFWEDYARTNKKGFTVPEWGGYPGTGGSGNYSGDSVLYTQKLVGRFAALAAEGIKVLECHFSESASYIADSLYSPNQMPAMATALTNALAAQPKL